jgi:hypothetical protein
MEKKIGKKIQIIILMNILNGINYIMKRKNYIEGDIGYIDCGNNQYALIDSQYFDEVSKYVWYLVRTYSSSVVLGYINKKFVRLRSFIKKDFKHQWTHKNGNCLDCRENNIVVYNHVQRCRKNHYGQNQYKGVYHHMNFSCSEWKTQIYFRKTSIYLGCFFSAVEGAYLYDSAVRYLASKFDEFKDAYLNFPKIKKSLPTKIKEKLDCYIKKVLENE